MGNSPLTICIHGAWEQPTVQVVQPDGQVLFMPQPISVADLQEAYPSNFVCHGTPSLIEQRLPADTKLEAGEIYYLLPMPRVYIPPPGFKRSSRPFFPRYHIHTNFQESQKLAQERPSTRSMDYTQMRMKPHQNLIRFFVFRHCMSSVQPEESLKPQGDYDPAPRSIPRKISKVDARYLSKAGRQMGRKPIITWRPQLESISELKAVHDFQQQNSGSFKFVETFIPLGSVTEQDMVAKHRLVYSA